ncbi:MAG: ATP-dependent transcriptional regulator [Rhodobacterales bacterium 32-67-9]|nr:MAG: ATP-dependent transcriptional regulator [Rhodobacterales bacterium 32-67-9]
MRHVLTACLTALVLSACGAVPPVGKGTAVSATAELPPMRRFPAGAASPPRRSNAEMARDFMDLSFALESGRSLPVLTRFEEPIRIRMTGVAPATAAEDLGRLLARLRSEAGIDIAAAPTGAPAQITVEFLPRKAMQRLVPRAACFVAPRVGSWDGYRRARRADLDWATLTHRDVAAIFIPNDTAPQEVRDCLHEELAQALGPLNDLYRLPDSVFNDDNIHTVLTGFDMLMLRATYAPDLRSGMAAPEVAARLPGLFARINPGGERGGTAYSDPTPRAYSQAIETALGPGTSGPRRRVAARTALDIAEARGWQDARTGFAWLALGRLSLGHDAGIAETAFREAARIYESRPELALQLAHADMQLAAFALSDGRADEVIQRTARALPLAAEAQNAALLASLLMVRAEALDLIGRASEARQVRLDSLGWARYGFASDAEVRLRLMNIAALSPASRTRHK